MTLQILLMEITFLAQVTEVIAVPLVKLLMILQFCVIDERLRASFKVAFVFRFVVIHSVSGQMLLGGK